MRTNVFHNEKLGVKRGVTGQTVSLASGPIYLFVYSSKHWLPDDLATVVLWYVLMLAGQYFLNILVYFLLIVFLTTTLAFNSSHPNVWPL